VDEQVFAARDDRAAGAGRAGAESPRDRFRQLAGVDVCETNRQPAPLETGELEQVLGELRQPVDLLARRPERRAQPRRGLPRLERELDLGLE